LRAAAGRRKLAAVEIQFPNSFTRDDQAARGGPLPLSAAWQSGPGGRELLYIFPLRLEELAETFVRHAQEECVLFGVDHNYYDTDDEERLTLDRLAGELGAPGTAADEETLLLPAAELPRLAGELLQHRYALFDLPEATAADAALALAEAAARRNWPEGESALEVLPAARLFFGAHDDCYVYAEARAPAPLAELLGVALTLLAGTALARATGERRLEFEPPDARLLDRLRASHPGLTVLQEEVGREGDRLVLPYAGEPYRQADARAHERSGLLYYDLVEERWEVEG
jgi:hypothetical protein